VTHDTRGNLNEISEKISAAVQVGHDRLVVAHERKRKEDVMRRTLLAAALSVAIGVPAAALANPFAPAAGVLGSAAPDGIELVKRHGGHVRHRAVHRARFAHPRRVHRAGFVHSRRVHHRRYHRPRIYRVRPVYWVRPVYVRKAHWHCHRHFRYGHVIRHCHWHRFGHH
jgi:hypothetical protein